MFKFCLLHFFTFFPKVKLNEKYFLHNNKIILHCSPSVITLQAKSVPIINTKNKLAEVLKGEKQIIKYSSLLWDKDKLDIIFTNISQALNCHMKVKSG